MKARRAPKGRFRVLCLEKYKNPVEDHFVGDFISSHEAKAVAAHVEEAHGIVAVYDDMGDCIFKKDGGTIHEKPQEAS